MDADEGMGVGVVILKIFDVVAKKVLAFCTAKSNGRTRETRMTDVRELEHKSVDVSSAWSRDRDEAERILAKYGRHVVPCLPDMVTHWLYVNAATTDPSQTAFDIACDLHSLTSRLQDVTTNKTAYFPMGKDVVLADTLVDIVADLPKGANMDVRQRLDIAMARLNDILLTEGGPQVLKTPSGHGEVSVLQVAVPFALNSETLLRHADALEVLKHIQNSEHDEHSVATKLTGTFGSQSAHLFPVRIGTPCTLSVEALRERLAAMCAATPSLLYRGLVALKLLGQDDGDAPSIALVYARHVENEFERGV